MLASTHCQGAEIGPKPAESGDGTEAIRQRMTPAEKDQAQMAMLRIHAGRRHPRGTRRKTDGAGPVKRYDMHGRRIA